MDTAGRLQIDERMMGELKATQRAIKPSDTLLVVDAMTGQEAASLTKAFNEAAELTGDQRGVSAQHTKRLNKEGNSMPFKDHKCGLLRGQPRVVEKTTIMSTMCVSQR